MTPATLLLEQGVDIRIVQEILGHSTLAVTKKYTHVTHRLAREGRRRSDGPGPMAGISDRPTCASRSAANSLVVYSPSLIVPLVEPIKKVRPFMCLLFDDNSQAKFPCEVWAL
jgi:hypothetical protein